MRDILVTLIVFGFIPFILVKPYVGILVWSWLGFMNPHKLCFGFAFEFPFSKIIGAVTIIAFLYYKDKILPKASALLWIIIAYTAWVTVTTTMALHPGEAMLQWGQFMKVIVMTFLITFMTNNKDRVNALIATIALSIGYFGFKGGLFTIMTAGAFHVWGPPTSFIDDNNALGLALVMTLPLLWYLHSLLKNKLYRYSMLLLMMFTTLAVLGTQSRGGFLALVAISGFMVMKSKAKFKVAAAVIILAPLLFVFMPQSWHDRMDTIKNYQQDESAMMRINAWEFSINLASDYPIAGGGYNTFTEKLFKRYSERPEVPWTGPHSIYFETLAEHGYVGLALFLMMLIIFYRTMGNIMKTAPKYEDMLWMRDLAAMIQVSLVGYMVAGVFLEMAKFDYLYALIAVGITMVTLLHKRQEQELGIPLEGGNKITPDMTMVK
jgi:putative inorganic carbon (HCO3(-)) transporter